MFPGDHTPREPTTPRFYVARTVLRLILHPSEAKGPQLPGPIAEQAHREPGAALVVRSLPTAQSAA